MKKPSLLVILGNQLFAPEHLPPPDSMPVFMAEDMGLCTYEKHHQQKIVLFLAAMRAYAEADGADSGRSSFDQVSPTLGIHMDAGAGMLYASYGRSFDTPTTTGMRAPI